MRILWTQRFQAHYLSLLQRYRFPQWIWWLQVHRCRRLLQICHTLLHHSLLWQWPCQTWQLVPQVCHHSLSHNHQRRCPPPRMQSPQPVHLLIRWVPLAQIVMLPKWTILWLPNHRLSCRATNSAQLQYIKLHQPRLSHLPLSLSSPWCQSSW